MNTGAHRGLYGQLRRFLLVLLLGVSFGGCREDAEPPCAHSSRVVLVYIAGDNNLSGYVQGNLDDMVAGMASAPQGTRTLVYMDLPGSNPRLAEVTASGLTTLHAWASPHNSVSAAVMGEVFSLTRQLAPADRYGLVLWSHGLAWLPSSADDYLVRLGARSEGLWPATKWFGQDTGETPVAYLDTAGLRTAVPEGMFDYILFDACFMASAEVLYELRDKTKWIICSPAEVLADGFPYDKIMPGLLSAEPDLRAVCETFYRRYAEDPRPEYRSAAVSLICTSELEALAAVTAVVFSAALDADPAVFSEMNLSQLQTVDRYRRHFLFDAGSVVDNLEQCGLVSAPLAGAWWEQLSRAVVWEAHTAHMLDLALRRCCGISLYVPYGGYPDLNEYYTTLGWFARCYPAGCFIAP